MKKLNLDMADLKVESFETFVPEEKRGTVHANVGCVTASCGGTCGNIPASDLEKRGDYALIFDGLRTPACCV